MKFGSRRKKTNKTSSKKIKETKQKRTTLDVISQSNSCGGHRSVHKFQSVITSMEFLGLLRSLRYKKELLLLEVGDDSVFPSLFLSLIKTKMASTFRAHVFGLRNLLISHSSLRHSSELDKKTWRIWLWRCAEKMGLIIRWEPWNEKNISAKMLNNYGSFIS